MVRQPDGSVAIDPTGRANGRGAYLCRDVSCWDAAARKRSLEHALGTAIPPDLRTRLTNTYPTAGAQPAPIAFNDQGGARGQE